MELCELAQKQLYKKKAYTTKGSESFLVKGTLQDHRP